MFASKKKYIIGEGVAGIRIDMALAQLEPDFSRQYFQRLIKEGRVFIGHRKVKPSFKAKIGAEVGVEFPPPVKMDLEAVDLPLEVVYEDESLLVVDKEAGMVVHPAAHGKFMGKSLVNAALAHVGEGLKGIGGVLRPGIVHRLDKDTSGLIIVAKKDVAHQRLVEMFKNREIEKFYQALIVGDIHVDHGFLREPIGRDWKNRKLMAVNGITAKAANTEFWVVERFNHRGGKFCLVKVALHTGRTHQIRVHFAAISHPLVGDKQYGFRPVNELFTKDFGLVRQFLHAYKIGFLHPVNQKAVNLEIGLPPELETVLKKLRKEA